MASIAQHNVRFPLGQHHAGRRYLLLVIILVAKSSNFCDPELYPFWPLSMGFSGQEYLRMLSHFLFRGSSQLHRSDSMLYIGEARFYH